MLLSLLSKRSLEVDSRDSYGFALRPQHTQRYKEYTYIYKEEEGERSRKWNNFLEQLVIYDQPCSNSKEEHKELLEVEDTKQITQTSVKLCEGDDTIEKKSGCDSSKERKTKKVRTWVNVRSSLGVIEHMMSYRVKKSMKNKQINVGGDCLIHTKEIQKDFKEQVCGNYELSNLNDSVAKLTQTRCDGLNGGQTEETMIDSIPDYLNVASPKQALNDERPPYPWKELEFLVQGGMPKDIRGEVWQAFAGVKARRVERYYDDLLVEESSTVENDDKKWKRQIEKDIPRTFPGHPALDENGRNSLKRLLMAYARHNPLVGYCQGMNFFAGIMLLLMPEESAFWTLVGIIDDYFEGYYTEQMIGSQVDQLVFEELVRERFPKLVNHLDYLGVQVTWLSGPWFLSIFVNMLPWESVLRIWDVLLYEGNRVMLFRTALALMELYGPALVTTKDAGDAISLLQSLAGSTFDSSQLVMTACMGFMTVTEAKLQELREKHLPAVLMVIEERSRGGRVWKDSKGLASKLYSFKHDRALVEEKRNNGANDKHPDGNKSEKKPHSSNLDDLLECLGIDTELESLPLQDQVVCLKVELCRLLEEKRSAVLRAEELETAFMEMVKEDNRLELSARIERLEKEVAELQEALTDKKEQEAAMLQVVMRLEQEQKLTEDARLNAEQDVAAQKYAVHVLQEKHDKAMASLADMEKRVLTAESMLEATLQNESVQNKAVCSPRFTRNQVSTPDNKGMIGRLAIGFGWRDRNKSQVKVDECSEANPNTPQKKTSEEEQER